MNLGVETAQFIYNLIGGALFSFGTFFIMLLMPAMLLSMLGFFIDSIRKRRLDASSFEGNLQAYATVSALFLIPFGIPIVWLCARVTHNFYSLDIRAFSQTPTFHIVFASWVITLLFVLLMRFFGKKPQIPDAIRRQ